MKFTIILILSIMLVGCKSTTVEKTLSDIETLMDCCPDSALNKLNKITPEQLTSDETNAHYALLYSQALDKNYIDSTNDSLILIAENYYTKHNDNKKSMLAHYYHGRVKYNAKEYPQSLYFITKAFHNAESLKDYYWMGRCAEEISIIYDENFHGSDALHYAQIAFDNLQKSGKQPYINYSLLNLARINNNNNNDSIANQIAKQVLDSAIVYNDSSLWILSKNISAKSFLDLKIIAKLFSQSMKSRIKQVLNLI